MSKQENHARSMRKMAKTVAVIARDAVWPKGLTEALGRATGTLSLLGLLSYALQHGLPRMLALLVSFYNSLLEQLFGWANDDLQALMLKISAALDISFSLRPYWKHIFVLLLIYFWREAFVSFSRKAYGDTLFCFARGSVVALAAAICAASTPSDVGIPAAAIVAGIPVVATSVYVMIGMVWDASVRDRLRRLDGLPPTTWWGHFWWGSSRSLARMLAGVGIIATTLSLPGVEASASTGLLILLGLTFLLALYWLWDGARMAARIRAENEAWIDAYRRGSYGRLGLSMIGVFLWVALLGLTGAGLGLLT